MQSAMGPPTNNSIPQAIPISLAQQLNMNRLQRPTLQRALMPRLPMGINQQQQQVIIFLSNYYQRFFNRIQFITCFKIDQL